VSPEPASLVEVTEADGDTVVEVTTGPPVVVVDVGDLTGAPGPPGETWVVMTQADYDALATKDPETLYIING
jgi:hypothetical protein